MAVKIKEIRNIGAPKIAVVGIGSGCEVIKRLKNGTMSNNVKLIALSVDSVAPTYIKDILHDSHFVIIATDLGIETQNALVVAQNAKELGAFTILITNRTNADIGALLTLQRNVDSILIAQSTEIIACAVRSIASAINSDGLNLDLADFEVTIKGFGFIGFSEKNGEDSALNATIEIIESFGNIKGANSALIHYTLNEKYPLQELVKANEILHRQLDKKAFCKQGWAWDNALESMQVRVMLIVAGF